MLRRFLRKASSRCSLPREQIFTHCGGWADGERLFRSAMNENSCPGWSFYRYGRDPLGDKTAISAASNAPYWAATEWLPIGARTAGDWKSALRNTRAIDRCRYVCIYNWRKVKTDAVALKGIVPLFMKHYPLTRGLSRQPPERPPRIEPVRVEYVDSPRLRR